MPRRQRLPEPAAGSGRSASSGTDEFTLSASGAGARRASEWLDAACRRLDVPPAQVERLALCLHEALANVVSHGGIAASSAPVRLVLEVRHERDCGEASVTVSDAGAAFDPLAAPEKVLPKTLDEASGGGLGLVMIRRCSDRLDYRYGEGCNHLTFGTRWSGQ
jgi:anti-sigma regulatory factor (Ser/Thr protein kinase)